MAITKSTIDKIVYCLGTLDSVKSCTDENSPKYFLIDKVIKRLNEVLKEVQ